MLKKEGTCMGINPTDAQISIANLCEETIYILIVPFKEWDWGDRGFTINSVDDESKSYINSLSSLIAKLHLHSMQKASEGEHNQKKLKEINREVVTFLNKEAIIIPAGQFKKITSDKGRNSLRTFALSGWGSLFGVSDLTLSIISATLRRQAVIQTNYNDSWVVESHEIGKAKSSSIWDIDRGSESYKF